MAEACATKRFFARAHGLVALDDQRTLEQALGICAFSPELLPGAKTLRSSAPGNINAMGILPFASVQNLGMLMENLPAYPGVPRHSQVKSLTGSPCKPMWRSSVSSRRKTMCCPPSKGQCKGGGAAEPAATNGATCC